MIVVVAVFLFLRGHNAPGGGFVAGLVISVGVLLQYIVSGTEWVEEHLRLAPRALIAVGLLLALATGAGAFVVDHPLLTSHTWHVTVPVLGDVHIPERDLLRPRRVLARRRIDAVHPRRAGSPVGARAPRGRGRLMELVLALAIGVLTGSGVWLVLRPRTFQLVLGFSLLSYAVNLFIFSMGSLAIDKEPILVDGVAPDLASYADPTPQALVLTAIVINFAMTALLLVIVLASRGMTGTDHVDGVE